MSTHTARCRSCGEPIYWAQTREGRRMPVDTQPTEGGNVLLTLTRSTGALTCTVLSAGCEVEAGRRRYTSHYATCPQAASHRRPRGPREVDDD